MEDLSLFCLIVFLFFEPSTVRLKCKLPLLSAMQIASGATGIVSRATGIT